MPRGRDFDPWALVAEPVVVVLLAFCTVRDFISDRRKSKS